MGSEPCQNLERSKIKPAFTANILPVVTSYAKFGHSFVILHFHFPFSSSSAIALGRVKSEVEAVCKSMEGFLVAKLHLGHMGCSYLVQSQVIEKSTNNFT